VKAILESVSRSFYLTIRFLPRPLREPVSLAYLLARATDTLADTATISAAIRLTTLRDFARVVAGELEFDAVAQPLEDFAARQNERHERTLIENLRKCTDWLAALDPADCADIRETLRTIVSGQELDVRRFGDPATLTSLRTGTELDEYTYLVAGCVGDLWTRLGFRHVRTFASRSPEEMTRLGIDYGKGLQLINVLRDRGTDVATGRGYLPVDELAIAPISEVFANWLARAEEKITTGIEYCSSLTNWRIRFATALPALIGARTIALLRVAGAGEAKIKVSRKEVRNILLTGARAATNPRALRVLFDRLIAPPL
jgi:farnesyl-diphosphate farnesyltransferase